MGERTTGRREEKEGRARAPKATDGNAGANVPTAKILPTTIQPRSEPIPVLANYLHISCMYTSKSPYAYIIQYHKHDHHT